MTRKFHRQEPLRQCPVERQLAAVDTAMADPRGVVLDAARRANGKLWYYSIMTWLIPSFEMWHKSLLLHPNKVTTTSHPPNTALMTRNMNVLGQVSSFLVCTNENQIIQQFNCSNVCCSGGRSSLMTWCSRKSCQPWANTRHLNRNPERDLHIFKRNSHTDIAECDSQNYLQKAFGMGQLLNTWMRLWGWMRKGKWKSSEITKFPNAM